MELLKDIVPPVGEFTVTVISSDCKVKETHRIKDGELLKDGTPANVLNDTLPAVGEFTLTVTGPDGKIKETRHIKNVVTTAGKVALAERMGGDTPSGKFMPYVGIGTGTDAASAADTQLQTEVARVAGTVTYGSNVYQSSAVFTAGVGTGTITEAGLLSASSSGTLFSHQVFGAVTKGAADSLTIVWQVTIS